MGKWYGYWTRLDGVTALREPTRLMGTDERILALLMSVSVG
jgi:hypothetical protein